MSIKTIQNNYLRSLTTLFEPDCFRVYLSEIFKKFSVDSRVVVTKLFSTFRESHEEIQLYPLVSACDLKLVLAPAIVNYTLTPYQDFAVCT